MCILFGARPQIIVPDYVDITVFQAAHPFGATLCPLDDVPPCVFTKGYAKLQQLAIAAAIAAPDKPAAPDGDVVGSGAGAFPSSLLACYMDIPSVLLLAISQQGGQPSGPPLVVGAPYSPPLVVSGF